MRKQPDLDVRPFSGGRDEWDAFAARHGTVFHTADWLDVMERTQGARLLRLGVYASGQPVGILPLFVKRYFPFTVGGSPLVIDNTPYQGLACEPAVLSQAVSAAGAFARRNGIHFLRLFQRERFDPGERDVRAVYVDKHTHVVDLTRSEDEIFKSMESSCRSRIRKAERNGVTVTQEETQNCIEPYYAILSALYLAQGMPTPNTLEFYKEIWAAYSASGLFVLTAQHEGRTIAGAMFLRDGDWVYYLSGAAINEYKHLEPSRAIQWRAMRLGKAMGASHYDFVGSDIPRLAEFKKSFGGALHTYTLVERASAPWVSAARRAFPRVVQATRRLKSTIVGHR